MNLIKFLTSFIILSYISICFSQGTIRGEIKDAKTGSVVPFAKIKIDGLNKGAVSDINGLFSFNVEEGSYKLIISAADFQVQEVNTIVHNNKVSEVNVSLQGFQVKQLESVNVVANRKTPNTIAGDDNRRKEASNTSDGISKEQMKTNGDGDLGEVAQRVTGVSVEGGKHVFVRGLGDRYTKTILNGMEIPGLDPERNTVQMDIFPTNLIDNVTVYKTFTPNLSGDFTGGLIDISTKDFPLRRTISFTTSWGYNTEATFNKDYISYKGGKLDALAFDDGTRALPFHPNTKFSDPSLNDPKLSEQTKAFGKTMATEKMSNFLDQNYSFSIGDQINKQKFDYGYNVVLNYRNNYRMYDNVEFNEYRKDALCDVKSLIPFNKANGVLSENDVLWSMLLGQSIKLNKKTKISMIMFHTQNGKKSASNIRSVNFEINPSTLVKQNLQYTQRSITNVQLNGSHNFKKLKVELKLAPTLSKISDPDIRSTILEEIKVENGEIYYDLNPSVGSEIRRIYRDLKEINLGGKLDFKYCFSKNDSLKNDLSFGIFNTFKKRDFKIKDYLFYVENPTSYSSDPNFYFQDENIWTSEREEGTYVKGGSQISNTYKATQKVMGAYVMNDLAFNKQFSATYGVRIEKATNTYTGQNNSGTIKYNKQKVLDELSLLPSVNAVYKLYKKKKNCQNIRVTYSKTIARPSFREISVAQIYDPIQNRRYNGNIDLKQTNIHNLDLRWENFFGRTELISASVFYKRFINPIEIVSFDLAPNEVKPVNAGVSDVYGAEFEVRKAIGFNAENKKHISLVTGFNFTFVISKINMNKVMIKKGTEMLSEKSLREENAREGEKIANYRPMFGQSPYIINGFVTFKNDNLGITFNISYNVQGKRLAVIGVGKLPDVYENPFHSLNLKIGKDVGKKKNWNFSLSGQNLLNQNKKRNYVSFKAQNQIYDNYFQGMTFSFSISYSFCK